ncbi:MAG: hypothetical protein A3C53_07430 [Omnitrophica WOR_2 bacterium RIFCSPHIGHO2_02_FULL_68_15]|nr:MAG: hypothetical protein A3C53_07430 [Omnitrophica WOR_2 bacterium RIFCSPHIGHO2_02_FULL_68_15]
MDAELTDDFAGVKTAIAGLSADGCTNIAAALCVARREATSSNANPGAVPVIVLLSDGIANTRVDHSTCEEISGSGCASTTDGKNDARRQADEIAKAGIVLYTISLGKTTDAVKAVPFMKEIANLTGGKHFSAPTTADLEAIFIEISQKIPAVLVE